MKNWYWRKESYEGLNEIIEISKGNLEWELFTNYCEAKEKGLRKKALKNLNEFIENLNKKPLEKRIEFTNWIEERRMNKSEVVSLIPYPLQKKLIEPTLNKWKNKEPNNPIPFRWINTKESLIHAIRIDPKEQIAKFRLFEKIIKQVDFSQHELREYLYIGSAENDLEELKFLKKMVKGINDSKKIYEVINERIEICEEYIEFKKDETFGMGKFFQFRRSRNSKFRNEEYL